MKCQNLFSGEKKKEKEILSICHLLNLPNVVKVKEKALFAVSTVAFYSIKCNTDQNSETSVI